MERQCMGPECEKPVRTSGLCRGHYNQRSKGRELTPLKPWNRNAICEIEGCDDRVNAQGLCHAHYRRMQLGQDMTIPKRRKATNGSGYVNDAGYRYVMHEGRSILEHRLVMERLMGRPLYRHENVHHVNGDRGDNSTDGPLRVIEGRLRSGNLELWSTRQPQGQDVASKVAFAREILDLYGDLVTR